MKKRVLSLFMALALCLTLLPTAALAEENTTEPSTQLTEPTPVPQEPKTPDQGENTETPDQPEEPSQDEPPAADEPPAVQSEPAPQAAVQAAEVPAENAVAQVGNVNYDDIQKAFDAVKGNGGTLTLLANCETPNTNEKFDISGNYTLDLNGCTLKGRLYLSKTSTSLTVKDSGTGGKIQATSGWSPLWVDGGDVTIESGTLATEKDTVQALVFGQEAACGTLTITGGSFKTGYVQIGRTGGTTVITGGAFHDLRVNGDSKRVTLSGGTFDTVKRYNGSTIAPTDLLADGYTFVDRGTGAEVSTSQAAALTNVRVVSKETVNALVSLTVDGTKTHYYGTFEEALTAAQKTQGGTLTLLNNVTTTPTDINSGTFTLDLNGHTLTSEYNATLVVIGGSLTIQDSKGGGIISSTSSDSNAVWCDGGNVTILGGSFPSALHWESGTVSLQGGAFRSLDSKAGSWLSAIPEGKALERNGQITDASEKELITEDGFYVLADHKEHNWLAGRCACGREHTDHTWEDGKCTVCHLPCSHGTIDGDGMCKTCGTQFAVRDDDGNYYKHLADALAESSVDDVTLVADDTLSEDVMLIKDIFFYPNGHTVSGEGAIVVPRGKRLVLGEKDETEKAGNAGAILVENGGTLMVDEGFTGTVQTLTVSETAEVRLLGGTYGTITGSREKAGTLLYYNTVSGEKHLAFQKQDGTFARYDQRISSETPLKNVTVVGCQDKQLTEACGETCEYCDGALRCRIGASGYRDVSNAIRDVPDGGTITLLRDYSAVYNISANTDHAYTIDLNGHSVRRNSGGTSLVVYAGTPKIIDSKGSGVIAGLEIDSSLDLTLADLLPKGWDFQKSDGIWLSTTELKGKTASNVTVGQLPIQSMNYPTEMSMTYGGAGTLLVNVKSTGAVTFQWYKVEDGNEKAVGGATKSNQFDLSALKLPAGKHIFRFSATCNGYKKMSQDIVITVQKADIRSGLITPPTAQENLTYTGQAQALITAGSVTSGGTMQYSLTKNGTYSQDIPTGTDAGAYTVWYRVIGDANHNDTAPASVAVRIGKKPLTITGVTAASKPYDGTTNADISGVTFNGVNLNRGTDYTVTASFDDAGVGSGKNITATVTLMEQAAKNYALEQSSFPTTGSITKAAAPDFTKETALVVVNGHEKTYTVTLPALPTLETPKAYGALTYEIGEIKLNDGYYTSGAKVENGKLTLPIQKNDVETTGSVGTVTVVIKSANYEDITLTVNVSAKNKLSPVLAGTLTLTPIKITYGEPLSKIKITGTMKAGDTVVEGTFSWQQPGDTILDASTSGHDVGWTFTPKDGNTYTEVTGTVKVPVAPKSIEGAAITLESADLEYNAAEQSPKITGVALEKWTENITYRIVSGNTATNVNDSLTLTIEGTGNYTGKAAVKWKITPREVTPAIEVASCTYTGDALEPTVTLKDGNEVIPTDEYTVEYSNNTNAGTGRVTIKDVAGGNYVIKEKTQDFTITKAAAPTNIQSGTLTITNGLHKTYSFDLSTLLPKLTAPCDYGTITYDKKVDTNLGVGSFITLVNGKTGELTLEANRSGTDEGQFGTITVTISTSNYQDITLTVNIFAKNKLTPVMDGKITASKITYGQALSDSSITGKMKDPNTGDEVNGTFTWTDGAVKPDANDRYEAEWAFTPDSEEYATVTDTATVEVAPKSIEGAVITLESADLEYNAAEQSPKITGVTLENWDETGITYIIKSGDKATDVSDRITLTIKGIGNYTGTATVEWKITPKTVTPTIEVEPCTYTGDALEPTVTVKDDIGNIIDQKEYEIFYSNNTNTGIATVTIKDIAGGNYVIKEKTQDFTITKAAAPTNIQSGTLTITNGLHKTYSFDLSTLLPKLTAPCDYGTITYDRKVDTNLGVGSFITLVDGKTGELTLDANRSGTDEGQFGTITVTVSTSNYQDITLTINVIAKNRITPTGTPTLSKNAITYGDALNTIALSGKLHDNVNNVDVDGTFEWVDGTHIPVVGNGTYAAEWIFEPTDTEKYLTVSGRSNITVEKAQQYGKLSMAGYTYGKTPSTPTLTDRTGDLNAQVTYRYSAAGSGPVQTWDIQNPPALNAGTYRMYASIGDTDNYYGFEAVYCEFVVAKATPTYTVPTGLTAKYGQTLADVTLPDGWSWTDSSESVGGASTAAKTFQAKFTPTDAVNYNMVENIGLEVMVNKADGGNLKTVELEQKYTDASDHTYTPDWAGLPAGQDWTFSSEASIVLSKQDFAADGSLLTYAISGGKAGDKITITLKASCDNYEDFTITLNVTLTEKDDQKPLTITGAGSVVYGQTLTLTTTGGSGTGTVTYRIDTDASTGEATIDPETGVLTPVKVGSVSVIATKAGDNDYNDVTSAPFVLMIKPATPTGEPNYTKITTSGKTLKDAALATKGSTLNPSDGKLEWVDDKGEPLPDDTTVKANTTYKWRFTPDDDNYTTLTGEVELYHKSSSGGGWYDSYYTIKATAGTGGSISPSGSVSVREGRDQTFTITPDKSYAVSNVKIDGKSIGAVKSYTFENVRRPHTIEVIFMKANGNPQTGVFVDVATGSYYEDAVDWAVENGITKGTDDTHFSPDGICTRAQAVTFLWRAAGSPKPETRTMPFTDVPAGSYYYDAVLWAVENGITKGTSDTTFSPNMTCTRAQIVAFLWRSEKSPAAGTANPFADVKSTAYYADAVLWAVKENITKGTTNTTFSPDADCTRAQIVTFLWRCKK